MKLAPVYRYLLDAVPALAETGGAAEFARAVDALKRTPAAYVLPSRDTAEPNPFMNSAVEHLVTSAFTVVIAVKNLSDTAGEAAVESLEPIRDAIRDALLNWSPDEGADFEGIEFVGGEMVFVEGSYLWWQDTFQTRRVVRSL